jgi:hypothetical protein
MFHGPRSFVVTSGVELTCRAATPEAGLPLSADCPLALFTATPRTQIQANIKELIFLEGEV